MASGRLKRRYYREFVYHLVESVNVKRKIMEEFREARRAVEMGSKTVVYEEGGTGDRLVKAGVALAVAVPEPIISNVIGATMVALGSSLGRKEKKHAHMKLREVLEELRRVCNDLRNITV